MHASRPRLDVAMHCSLLSFKVVFSGFPPLKQLVARPNHVWRATGTGEGAPDNLLHQEEGDETAQDSERAR